MYQQPPYRNERPASNGMAIAGFVLALCSLVFCWVPVLNWILLILALIFSIVGVMRPPRGLAIAGLIISGFVLLGNLVFFSAFFGALAY